MLIRRLANERRRDVVGVRVCGCAGDLGSNN